MKLLFLQQPWLNLIVLGHKTLETRMWTRDVNYRGQILLAASRKAQTLAEVYSIMSPEDYKKFIHIKTTLSHDIFKPLGVAACVVRMTDYRYMNRIEDPPKAMVQWSPGRKVLVFDSIRPIETFTVERGMLGLLNCPQAYIEKIKI